MLERIQEKVGVAADGVWGPKTRAAVAAVLGCKDDDKAIQKVLGVAVDGVIGKKSVAALAEVLGLAASAPAGLAVFIDIGHTADRAREWPGSFARELWASDGGKEILEALGITAAEHDSLEHVMNKAVGEAVARHLVAAGVSVRVFDKPTMGNDAEISAVIAAANEARPRVFVSVHHNASGGKAWPTMSNTASGHVCYYVSGRNAGRTLARGIAERVAEYRELHGCRGNRAESVQTGSYAVIRKLDSGIAACLVEVGFYDNLADARFIARDVEGLGSAIAAGIRASL